MIKKLYPWIPIIGIPLTLASNEVDTGLNNMAVAIVSAVWQAGWCLALLFKLLL